MPVWNWSKTSEGKVRDIYEPSRSYDQKEDYIALVAKDRVSAFDTILPIEIQDKGKILTRISNFWFDLTEDEIPNARVYLSSRKIMMVSQPALKNNTIVMKKLRMLPIEAIVRGYITGSLWAAYIEGAKDICGIELPKNLTEAEKLPEPIFTPTTKAPIGEHDANISFEQMIEHLEKHGFENPVLLAELVRKYSLELYEKARLFAEERGIILADTKFEFGLDKNGTLLLADELLTPDSSRFWPADKYKAGEEPPSLDKQIIRDWIKEHGKNVEIPSEILDKTRKSYIKCYEMLTGEDFYD